MTDNPTTDDGGPALKLFLRESNAIEGILREPSSAEVSATAKLLSLDTLTIDDVLKLQAVYAPGAPIRDRVGMNVSVGRYSPPKGCRHIVSKLQEFLIEINEATISPWQLHCEFESLHPFMDGNGRTGRALWAWHMQKIGHDPFALSFLHRFYYQTLDALPARQSAMLKKREGRS